MLSFMLIHPTIWPPYTNVTDKTDRQTGQTQQSVALAESTSVLSGILIYPAVWRQRTWAIFFGGGELGPHLTQCGLGRVYLHAMFHFDPCNRLATTHQRYRQTGQDNGPIA